MAGARVAAPRKMATAPTPTSAMAGLASPMASRITPTRASAVPAMNRRRSEAGGGPAVIQRGDRRDAHGAAGRPERGHDRDADADQQPDHRGARLEDQRSGRQAEPEPAQQRLEPERGQHAEAQADHQETSPVMAASPSTDRKTWRRGPTIRSGPAPGSAPTMIENVLKMVNAPTNSEMNAKTSGRVEEAQRLVDRVRVLVHHGLPGDHLRARGQDLVDGLLDWDLSAPDAVTTLMSSSLPISWAMACAVGSVNAARVAPARLFAVPNSAMPVMVNVWVAPAVRIGPADPR